MAEEFNKEEVIEKAKLLAEATGRDYEDVLEDLLDDGMLNESNIDKPDLVEQLKEAAELITTVQAISQEVAENTVLNGGENKTEVKVETTLEGDVVDRAIASVQRKADDMKKLIATLIPIFLLLTGGSMEAFGVTNFFGSDSDSDDDFKPPQQVMGCMNSDAENYNDRATIEDGSCIFNGTGGNGTIPPPCDSDWIWTDVVINDLDSDGQGFNNDLRIVTTFRDRNQCDEHMNNGFFEVSIGDYDTYRINNNFHDEYRIDDLHTNIPAGDYRVAVVYHTNDGSHWEGPSALITMEEEPVQPVYGCTDSNATNYDSNADTDDGSCMYPPPPSCDQVILYSIQFYIVNESSEVDFDLDCNNNATREVMVSFYIIPNGSDIPVASTYNFYNITGQEWDVHTLALQNFVDSNYTHYDLFWNAVWVDDEDRFGEIRQERLNVRFLEDAPSEPSCDDTKAFNITSLSATFVTNGSDAIDLKWSFEHDGPDGQACWDFFQIEIALYKDGAFYDIFQFSESDWYYASGEGVEYIITGESVSMFSNLSSGEYDALLKFWEDGSQGPSQDIFTNKVRIL